MKTRALLPLLTCLFTGSAVKAQQADYPEDYRQWLHVKSGIITPDHPVFADSAGLHHIYANPLAAEGLARGQYKSGAVFVADFLNLDSQDHGQIEGARLRIDVMQFDPERFPQTDGWGYASFATGSKTRRVSQDVVNGCHACHRSAADSQFVFSRYRQ